MNILEYIFEFIAAVRSTTDIESLVYVTFDAKLNSLEPDLMKYLNNRYEIYKKNIEFCSKMNSVSSFLNVKKSIDTENMYM